MKITYNKTGRAVKMIPVSSRFFYRISTTGTSGWKGITYTSIKNQRKIVEIDMK